MSAKRKKERENINEFRGHCVTLLQCTACTATLGPICKIVVYRKLLAGARTLLGAIKQIIIA